MDKVVSILMYMACNCCGRHIFDLNPESVSKMTFKSIEKKVSQYAIPLFPARFIDGWEKLGRGHPRLFTPLAFELTYLARK